MASARQTWCASARQTWCASARETWCASALETWCASARGAASWPVRDRKTSSRLAVRRANRSTLVRDGSTSSSTARISPAPPVTETLILDVGRVVVDDAPAELAPHGPVSLGAGQLEVESLAGHPRLEGRRRSGSDDATDVQDGNLVGQLVSLVEVLGGEQDRHPGRGQRLHDIPEALAAARIQAGGRLVQEDHVRVTEQPGGQIQPPAHAAGVRLHAAVGGVEQIELFEQLMSSTPSILTGQPAQAAHHPQVLAAGLQLIQRDALAGQADPPAHLVSLGHHVIAGDPSLTSVRGRQGGQDPHGRGLARAVRAEHGQDGTAFDAQVYSVQDRCRPVGLGQPGRFDGVHLASPNCIRAYADRSA